MRRFIIHVGAHKTGTSAFQTWLVRERDRLARSGLLVPATGASKVGNYRPLAQAFADPADIAGAELLDRLEREIERHPDHDVIVSAERFSEPEMQGAVPRIRRRLDRMGVAPSMLVAVRDQAGWLTSRYVQDRKMMLDPAPFDRYVDGMIEGGAGDWERYVSVFWDQGFATHAVPYDWATRTEGIVNRLLRTPPLAGRAIGDIPVEDVNPTLGAYGLIVVDLVRDGALADGVVLPAIVRQRLLEAIRKVVARTLTDVPYVGVEAATSTRIAAAFGASNERLARRHLGASWADLFPAGEARPRSPQQVGDLSDSEAGPVRHAAEIVIAGARDECWYLPPQRRPGSEARPRRTC